MILGQEQNVIKKVVNDELENAELSYKGIIEKIPAVISKALEINNRKLSQQIQKLIEDEVKKQLRKVSFLENKYCRITAVNADGTYQVNIPIEVIGEENSYSSFFSFPAVEGLMLEVDDIVIIEYPRNNIGEGYIKCKSPLVKK